MSCPHSENDQIGPACIACGRIKWPRPEVVVLVGSVLYFGAHLAYWASIGFEVTR